LREAFGESRGAGQVGLVHDEKEAAPLGLGRDDPAVQQVLVDRHVGRHDAEHLGHVGGDQLFVERIRTIEKTAPRCDTDDHAAARFADDLDAVAACKGCRAALQHAFDHAAAVVEVDAIVTPMRRDDETVERFASQVRRALHTPSRASTTRTGGRSWPRKGRRSR
jgi:hypothetical protein